MNHPVRHIIILILAMLCLDVSAQISVDIDINKKIVEAKAKTDAKSKKKKKAKVDNQPVIPDIEAFTPIISTMKPEEEYSSGAFGYSWGDPVENPRIRNNTANNLYGEVRFNEDGSKRWHRGFDYYAPVGTPVMSVGNGTVESIGKSESYGLYILVKHERELCIYYSFYAHLSSSSVKQGQNVQMGTVIGKSGISGNASDLSRDDEHLHLEYRIVPESGKGHQANPNAIVKTKFYSADPDNPNQSQVGVVKKTVI